MIEQNLDTKTYPTARAIEFINKENEEPIAVFAQDEPLTIPRENSIVSLRKGTAKYEKEGIEYGEENKYRVIDTEYNYVFVEYEDSEDFEEGDQIIISAEVYVESVAEE